ncbi:MAG: hypothetical protein K2P58_10925 [Hyphomonadaceae bacterium]|nr:hypothetical protein [Hyphomonadaceae bacterium]
MSRTTKLAALAAVALIALPVVAIAGDADARERRARGSVETARGTYQGEASTVRQRGQRTRDATITGPNGGQRTVHDEQNWNRREGVYTRDRTTIFNDGTQRTLDTDVLRTGRGTYSASREVTGRNGETRVQTGDFTRTRTENGRTLTGDINTSNHGQIDYQRNISREDGVRSVNSSATFEDGTSITRASTGSCDAGTCTSQGLVTNRNGGQTSWDASRTRTENSAIRERDITYADGTTRSIDYERIGNGDGTGVINRSVTGRNGETRTQTGEYEIDRTP